MIEATVGTIEDAEVDVLHNLLQLQPQPIAEVPRQQHEDVESEDEDLLLLRERVAQQGLQQGLLDDLTENLLGEQHRSSSIQGLLYQLQG